MPKSCKTTQTACSGWNWQKAGIPLTSVTFDCKRKGAVLTATFVGGESVKVPVTVVKRKSVARIETVTMAGRIHHVDMAGYYYR